MSPAVQEAFRRHGVDVTEKTAGTIPEILDVATRAARSNVDRLWVLGGDGTLASAASSLCYSKTALCPLPGGTAGVFCRELNIPSAAPQAVSSLLSGRNISIDVGQVGDVKFLLMAGVGIDAQTVRDVNLNLKRCIGPLAYVAEGLRKLWSYSVSRVTVVDEHGIERTGYHVVVLNGRLYGGSLAMAPSAKLDDGRFDVILIKKPGRLALLKFVFSIPSGRHVRLPYVEYFRSNAVEIRGDGGSSVQADGDCLTRLPARITILPKALTVRAPQ